MENEEYDNGYDDGHNDGISEGEDAGFKDGTNNALDAVISMISINKDKWLKNDMLQDVIKTIETLRD